MKSLKESLLDDIDVVSDKIDARMLIEEWLRENLRAGLSNCKISEIPNKDGKYEVSFKGYIEFKREITSLTNGMFVWANSLNDFECNNCSNLTSLEGVPKEVKGNFHCCGCSNLISLEGSPEIVQGNFDCSYCDSLKTLEVLLKQLMEIFFVRAVIV